MRIEENLHQIYVVHYSPLKERLLSIEKSLTRISSVPKTYKIMDEETDRLAALNFSSKFQSNEKRKSITSQELSVSLAHLEVYKDIVKNNYKTCLVLEDDAILSDMFFDEIEKILEESKEFDFTFLSSCCDLHTKITRKGLLQESTTTRSVCGYIVNSYRLKNVIRTCEPFIDVIDWHLNHIKDSLEMKYAWSEPPLIFQGSETKFGSNLEKKRAERSNKQ